MKIQELRIGNLVYLVYPDGITHKVEITGILPDKVFFKGKSSGFSMYEAISPIPLTEEILSEFTMKWGTDPQEPNALMVFKNGEFEILKFEDEDHFFYSNGRGFHADIIYLHQLQNLYFDLTGEKLEVEL